MNAVPTHIFFHANCVNLRTECSFLGQHIPPHTNGSFAGCTSLDTDVPSGCAQLHLMLPFPDSRRQKAEADRTGNSAILAGGESGCTRGNRDSGLSRGGEAWGGFPGGGREKAGGIVLGIRQSLQVENPVAAGAIEIAA